MNDTCLSILQNKFKNIVVVNIDMKNTNDVTKIEIMFIDELSKKIHNVRKRRETNNVSQKSY